MLPLLLVLGSGCVGTTDPPLPFDDDDDTVEQPVGWHTDGPRIRDPQGRHRILHGINISNDVKRPPYDSWAQEEDYARLQDWGFSAIRLLTGWAALMPAEGVIDEEYLDRYEARVDLAEQHGLAVIVDMHQDVFGEGFGGNGGPLWACDQALYDSFEPQTPWYMGYFEPEVQECYDRFWSDEALQDRFIEAFVAVAERVAEREHVVGFDLYNEPSQGTTPQDEFHADVLQPFYERVMDALADVAPGKLFFVEPLTNVQFAIEPAFVPFDRSGVVYAPHYYHPGVHDWGSWDGNPEPMRLVLDSYVLTAERLDVPWLMGELGGLTASTNFEAYMRTLYELLDARGVGSTYWEYSKNDGGFSPLNGDGSEKPHLVDVFARAYPKSATGTIASWSFDQLTGSLSVDVVTPTGPAQLVIALPAAHQYPTGFEVQSTDGDDAWSWELDADARELRVTLDPAIEAHTVTVTRAP